ncbi:MULTISPECIES: hypothetical protein [unclassified Psychrobacter]|uniref:hypothetical protein n=1 Tax=unclassified Psychrobacter TaxID=196806 RepID=UPI0025B39D9C|nr:MULTISPECIES: hypothetical protein [unclassified Psychrobacter]MDN3453446.1 hypothetical protein [Psychrobacter sp. APC 3350]MDN3503802.1 hypothetical protein [Psychrobacter sp. 5A.1]
MSTKKNVWLSGFNMTTSVNFYDIYPANNKKYGFPKYWKIFESREKTADPKLLEIKKMYKEDRLELSKASSGFFETEHLPDSLWVESSDTKLPPSSEHIFFVRSGGVVLTQACAELLQQFRLGESTLTPVQIYNLETQQLCSDKTFYFLNLCERREYIQYPHPQVNESFSSYTSSSFDGKQRYATSIPIKDKQLLVSKSALNCELDLWHDPLLMSYVFVSDALHDALVQADMDTQWNMVSCQLV